MMKRRRETMMQVFMEELREKKIMLKSVPKHCAEDLQLCLVAVRANPYNIEYLPDSLEDNIEIALEAVTCDGMVLQFYEHEGITSNYEVCMAAVMQEGMAYGHMFYTLQEDRDLALAAVRQNGLVLRIVSDCFEDDWEVNLAAVCQNGCAIQWAFQDFIENRDFALAAVRQNGFALSFLEGIFDNDFEFVSVAIEQNGMALLHASDELKDNFQIVSLACTKKCDNFETPLMFASTRLKDDEDIVRIAVQTSGTAIRCASERLLLSHNMCQHAIEQNPCSLFVFHPEMKNNRKIVRAAIIQAYMRCTNKYDFFDMRNSLLFMASSRLNNQPRAIRYIMRGEYMIHLMPFPDVVGRVIFEYLE